MNLQKILQEFITLWVVIDPIGTLPVFLAVTAGMSVTASRRLAVRAVTVAFMVLLSFIVLGQLMLEALGISLASFQIAGGIVLFLFALTMIFGDSKPDREVADESEHPDAFIKEKSVYPLAMPSIASPGAMLAVVILTDNDRFSISHQFITATLMALIMLVVLALLLLAHPILRLIGTTGASVISRVMGLLLAAVAVNAVLTAFVQIGVLPALP
ncbi:MarC family protein [Paracoccus tegillarcae]|uniref:UPF0056 membrane protein n=1 Tax=Paracoccus tegillarcae TaxID=1529068 RepID=A0A2K9EGN3_9RHOB|nr:MarC family protein [Paracoccus tegillarcae]AUH34138.1 MarC family transcriptional regulator [Paracoccus tegillarcae]